MIKQSGVCINQVGSSVGRKLFLLAITAGVVFNCFGHLPCQGSASEGNAGGGDIKIYSGGLGNDTYRLTNATKVFEIYDNFFYDGENREGIDTISMVDERIRLGNIRFESPIGYDHCSLKLYAGVENGSVTISDFNLSTGRIEQMQFGEIIYNLKFIDQGDNRYDRGYVNANSILVGFDKEDVIIGGLGNDIFYGQGGSDTLRGGQGSDTYVFSEDFGDDTIIDAPIAKVGQYETNCVILGGLSFADTAVLKSGEDLILESKLNPSNKVRIDNFFSHRLYAVDRFEFKDGMHDGASIANVAVSKDESASDLPVPEGTQAALDDFIPEEMVITVTLTNGALASRPAVKGYIQDGWSMVPIRYICEIQGVDIAWDATKNEVRIVGKGGDVYTLPKDSLNATHNGQSVALPVKPSIRNGVLMVPVSFIAEVFTLESVKWDCATSDLSLKLKSPQ